jgi:DNA-binding NarL/FixJ family response regulator
MNSNRSRIGDLTPREREVVEAVIAGQTDREIGASLYISHRTVHNHLQNIFDKLGVRTRTQVAVLYLAHLLTAAQ